MLFQTLGPPIIVQPSVYENVSIGSTVGVINSSDADVDSHLTFSLLTNAQGLFRINDNALLVNGRLDFERQSEYRVTIQARDNGFPSLTSTSTLNITVLDSNDPPKRVVLQGGLIKEYVNDPNGTQNGSFVGNLSTIDEDVLDSHYYEVIDPISSPFAVVGSSLVVSCAGLLDYESHNQIPLEIRSTDKAGATVTSRIVVRLSDVNERPTAILLSAATFTEHAQIGTVIGTLSARDPDRLGNHTFILRSNPGGSFQVNDDQLVLNKDIDFETTHNSLRIGLRVTDNGELSYDQELNITILNKNEPPQTISLTTYSSCSPGVPLCVPENKITGYHIAQINVQDPDRGDAPSCEIISGDFIGVDKGKLVTKGKINYEALAPTHVITVTLQCRDKGGLSIEKVFNVSVTDTNDPPSNVYLSHYIISSTAPVGSLVGTLKVEDEDAGDSHNCLLINSDRNVFEIHGLQVRTRDVLTNATHARQLIQVWCHDSKAASSHLKDIYIDVKNINMSRVINITLDSNQIAENKPAGSLVGHVFAWSHDPAESFSFQLDMNDDSAFALTGGSRAGSRSLVTTRSLDYEKRANYTVVIRVYGNSGRTNFEKFLIKASIK